jgi:hypothetical protein
MKLLEADLPLLQGLLLKETCVPGMEKPGDRPNHSFGYLSPSEICRKLIGFETVRL